LVPGEQTTILYRAKNIGTSPSTGTATFNVTPQKAGPYFMKIECFCFTEQTLQPGESMEMPVSFFVDSEIGTDTNTMDVDEIVLSYTFFEART
jgi:cytochrome c oxidase assembly protein subunit 11